MRLFVFVTSLLFIVITSLLLILIYRVIFTYPTANKSVATFVSCETGFDQAVKYAVTDKDGTYVELEDGTTIKFGPAIKCAVGKTSIKSAEPIKYEML